MVKEKSEFGKGLDLRGFGKKDIKEKDALDLMNLTKEIALDIDKLIGLNPEIGSW